MNLVIGNGEIGSAIARALMCPAVDIGETMDEPVEAIHICFPYSDTFVNDVKLYQEQYDPSLTIIHSTVPIGTSDLCDAVHSPVRGVHPDLYEGVMTFVKFLGGEKASEAAKIFKEKGISTKTTPSAKTTEGAKLWSTTQHGVAIMLNKEIHEYCKTHGLDFDIVYTEFNETYNHGYKKLTREYFSRPVLKFMEGPIGGHCVVPNCHLLGGKTAQDIINKNEQL